MRWDLVKAKILHKKIGIAGCGGLGSNAAVALVRVGIKQLVLADFDTVECSNLNRQYYFSKHLGQKKVDALCEVIHDIHADVVIEAHDITLTETNIPDIFKDCDIVIEAFDQASAKQMIAETMLDKMPDTPLIMGNGMAGIGNFEQLKQEKWGENLYVCGDFESAISDELPPLAPRVAIVANMQANLALEILLSNKEKDENHTK